MPLFQPPGGRPWALLGLCGASLLFNIVLGVKIARTDVPIAATGAVATLEPVAAPAEVADLPVAPEPAEGGSATASTGLDGMHFVHASVEHSLARTFQSADPDHGDVLSAVYSRLFFWDLDLRSDLQRGDEVAVAYEWDGALAHIPVATYASKKLGRTLHAYQFQASGDPFPSWWDETGKELSVRIVNGPLESYEQVTSLLKDRTRHRGMDFKVPEGSPVHAPKAGVVVRANWNVANNGNCVELQYSDGTLARFLHLSRTDVKADQHVPAGATVGLSGNTGHSTAPHLHYELERNGTILDPLDYHEVTRRVLPEGDRAAFGVEMQRLNSLLATES